MATIEKVLFVYGDDITRQTSMVVDLSTVEETSQIKRDLETMMKHASIVQLDGTKIHYLSRPYTVDLKMAATTNIPHEELKMFITDRPPWYDAWEDWATCCELGPEEVESNDYFGIKMKFPYPHAKIRDVIHAAYEINQDFICQKTRSYDVIIAVEETFRKIDEKLLAFYKRRGKNE